MTRIRLGAELRVQSGIDYSQPIVTVTRKKIRVAKFSRPGFCSQKG
jgi:hypothetical protein